MSETLVDNGQIDSSKRTWLIASSCAGAVGAGAVAVPFVSTFSALGESQSRWSRSRG